MTYDEMLAYCEEHRGEDRFCGLSSSCSGPCRSNLYSDDKFERQHKGIEVYRGGSYGSCRFEVAED